MLEETTALYEKDGEKYFVVDGHVHYWDASPDNRNKYWEGFIKCFYDSKRIFVSSGAPLIVDPDGRKVPEEAVVEHLRFARTVRVSIEGNARLCRGLLATRYSLGEKEEEVKR